MEVRHNTILLEKYEEAHQSFMSPLTGFEQNLQMGSLTKFLNKICVMVSDQKNFSFPHCKSSQAFGDSRWPLESSGSSLQIDFYNDLILVRYDEYR